MGTAMAVIAILLTTGVSPASHAKGYSILAACYVFSAVYSFTGGPVTWVYLAEIYPQSIRARAVALGTASSWLTSFGIAQLTPYLINALGWGVFAIFAGCSLVSATWQYFILPETKHKTLEEIGMLFARKAAPKAKDDA
ncbi:general substrate transporter [Syncephalis pseudoplumigaleata]|uniref:General substrate transporter n=1 Tax=Syncephalis pseudoplumigaleata TaxID=1712513 RepID=A0A4P9YVC7_9FUNG|nr:general substrate transporter [Syncephalis pseudoplumigaleata]|eukprot:RKP23745.1 general substrate transporter [Syncephalis pseudoplumigaleata]